MCEGGKMVCRRVCGVRWWVGSSVRLDSYLLGEGWIRCHNNKYCAIIEATLILVTKYATGGGLNEVKFECWI